MDTGGSAGGDGRDGSDTEPEFTAACRAVRNLLQAQRTLIEALSTHGMLDARATGVLAAIDQLKAEAQQAHQRATDSRADSRQDHPVGR